MERQSADAGVGTAMHGTEPLTVERPEPQAKAPMAQGGRRPYGGANASHERSPMAVAPSYSANCGGEGGKDLRGWDCRALTQNAMATYGYYDKKTHARSSIGR